MAEAETRAADDETVDYETAYIRDLDPNPDPSANDIFPTEVSNQGGYKTTIAQIGIVTNGVSGVCTETAANVKDKIVVLSNYNGKVLPREFDVTFTNGNSYGDTTAASPTFPTLYVYNKDGKDFLGSVDVGDSRGHYAGSGCWNAGDTMQFRIMNNKACITNSDVRQATSEYTIMSDGSFVYSTSQVGNKFYSRNIIKTTSDSLSGITIEDLNNLVGKPTKTLQIALLVNKNDLCFGFFIYTRLANDYGFGFFFNYYDTTPQMFRYNISSWVRV